MEDDILSQFESGINSFFGHYETKIMRLRNLLEITKIVNSTLEEDKLAQIILYSCQGQFLVQNATLIIVDDVDKGIYYDKISIGLEKDSFGLNLDKNSNLVSTFMSPDEKKIGDKPIGKKSYFFKEILPCIENPAEKKMLSQLNPEVICPLWGKNSLYGFIILGRKLDTNPFSYDELGYIYQFSELAAISVENAKLFEMAIIDRMTRLYNHQYFKNRLYEEIERSKRYKNPLSLMFFDIDHFKSFNDTYGHQQGDIVLKEVASIIRDTVRKSDVPSRYGGEEFSVILAETSLEQAFVVGEKIRCKIESHQFPGQSEPLHVTISCGIAQFPIAKDFTAVTSTDFIEMADQALYYSKRNGRNQVNLYSENISESLKLMEDWSEKQGHGQAKKEKTPAKKPKKKSR